MSSDTDFPLNLRQLQILTMEKNRKKPILWRKDIDISENDVSQISKKYSLPFWPESLKDGITKILDSSNNGNTKLSFIFQLNLSDFTSDDLPSQGLLQFYCSENNIKVNDSHECDKAILEKIANFKSSGSYQIIYIDDKHLTEKAIPPQEILCHISRYNEGEISHSLKFKKDYFEIAVIHNSMYHILNSNDEDTSNINETFGEYVEKHNSDEINEAIKKILKNDYKIAINVYKTLFNPQLTSSHGNKTGGFPVYLDKDNRDRNKTKYDFLLFQIDTRTICTSEEESVNDYENLHKVINNTPEYVMGLNVNREQLNEWSATPTLNFKNCVETIFHKQYM